MLPKWNSPQLFVLHLKQQCNQLDPPQTRSKVIIYVHEKQQQQQQPAESAFEILHLEFPFVTTEGNQFPAHSFFFSSLFLSRRFFHMDQRVLKASDFLEIADPVERKVWRSIYRRQKHYPGASSLSPCADTIKLLLLLLVLHCSSYSSMHVRTAWLLHAKILREIGLYR